MLVSLICLFLIIAYLCGCFYFGSKIDRVNYYNGQQPSKYKEALLIFFWFITFKKINKIYHEK